jgi:DNA (cytosine-5)-methyltransferase 1
MVVILVVEVKPLWWNKSRRAQTNEDYETWVEGGVVPTMNAFDNGDTRATTIIFYGNRVGDMRLQNDKINTLQARMGTGGNNMPMVATTQVRRLMPLECERLQGFPDGWTDGQSDTNRYKQMGNAVAVPVVEWIIQGICDTI